MKTLTLTFVVICASAVAAFSQAQPTAVAGIVFDGTAQVGGENLTLNGAGVRTKLGFKVYAAALYLSEGKTTAGDVLDVAGAKRVKIVMLRDTSTDDLGASFNTALNGNATTQERTRILPSVASFNRVFEIKPVLMKSDTVTLDWIPGRGLSCHLNDRSICDGLSDYAFYQAILKVWLGSRAVEEALKTELLRGPAVPTVVPEGIRREGTSSTRNDRYSGMRDKASITKNKKAASGRLFD
jgi:hypothetical protein